MSYVALDVGELFIYVVYLGVGASGKSTNVLALRDLTGSARGGKMLQVVDAAHGFTRDTWDFLHPTARVGGLPVRVHVWWRGGLHFNRNAEDYFLGGGADGAVLVVDSDLARLGANEDYLHEVDNRLPGGGFTVVQYNKRDVPNAAPVSRLDAVLNPRGRRRFEAVATRGIGVADTLGAVTERILRDLQR